MLNSLNSSDESDNEREVYDITTRSGRKFIPYGRNKKMDLEPKEDQKLLKQLRQNNQTTNIKEDKRKQGLNKAREVKWMKNKCSQCEEIGHFGVDCPRIKQYAVCTRCGNVGHEYN